MIISGTSPIHIAESLEKGKGLRWCWWCWCWCWCCCWCWCWWWMLKKTKRLTSIMIWRGSCQRCEPDAHRTEPGKSDGRCWGAGFKFFFSLKEYIDVAFPFFLKLKKNLIFRNVFKVRAELRGCTYLEDSSVTIRGVKIYGEPYNIFVIVMMLEIMMTTMMMMMTSIRRLECYNTRGQDLWWAEPSLLLKNI